MQNNRFQKYTAETISKSTPFNVAKAAFNFEEALFDIRHKLPKKDFGIFELIEDYGIRILSYGNAGGGKFGGPYRFFLIEYKGYGTRNKNASNC